VCSSDLVWAMYLAMAQQRGIDWSSLGGTLQNDILKEFHAQNEFIYPPEASLNLVVDTIEFQTQMVPRWNSVSISGYHIREAGSSGPQELAFTLREGGHIRVTLFLQHLSPRVRRFFEFWCITLAMAVSVYFTWYMGLLVLESFTYNDLSSGMVPVPIWIPQSAMLAGLTVLSIALADELFGLMRGADPSYHNKGENLLEDKEPIPNSIVDAE